MKKGVFILSDLMWFFVFVVIAVLVYFILFKSLGNSAENRIDVSTLSIDADYIASTLPHLPIRVAKDEPYANKDFAALLQELDTKYHDDPATLAQSDAYADYVAAVNLVFADPAMQRTTVPRGQTPISRKYAVALYSGPNYIPGTCKEYPAGSGLCTPVEKGAQHPDPETGLQVPYYERAGDLIERGPRTLIYDASIDVGTAYVPTDNGYVLLFVAVGGVS